MVKVWYYALICFVARSDSKSEKVRSALAGWNWARCPALKKRRQPFNLPRAEMRMVPSVLPYFASAPVLDPCMACCLHAGRYAVLSVCAAATKLLALAFADRALLQLMGWHVLAGFLAPRLGAAQFSFFRSKCNPKRRKKGSKPTQGARSLKERIDRLVEGYGDQRNGNSQPGAHTAEERTLGDEARSRATRAQTAGVRTC